MCYRSGEASGLKHSQGRAILAGRRLTHGNYLKVASPELGCHGELLPQRPAPALGVCCKCRWVVRHLQRSTHTTLYVMGMNKIPCNGHGLTQ